MKEIQISQGYITIVDDIDYTDLIKYDWTIHKKLDKNGTIKRLYALRMERHVDIKRKNIQMHQQILNYYNGQIDHINHDGLDNRRRNLRICDNSQNKMNSRLGLNNTTGYKGVCFDKHTRQFMAQINYHKHRIYLGRFYEPIDAAKAYDQKAIELFKKFAYLNFPLSTSHEMKK